MTTNSVNFENMKSWNETEIMNRLNQGVNALFKAKTQAELKRQYRLLISRWHPDHKAVNNEKKANDIFQNIQALFEEAQNLISTGQPVGIKEIILESSDKSYSIAYLKKEGFELGTVFTGRKHLTYLIEPAYILLFERAIKNIEKLKYVNAEMKSQFSKTVPKISKLFKTINGQGVLIIDKPEDMLSLSHVQSFLGGKIEPRHTAWILSNLYNISCFLSYNQLSHNAIMSSNIYINPKTHEVALLGGWWYSAFYADTLLALHYDAASLCAHEAQKNKKPDIKLDQKLIAQTGMDMLGSRAYQVLLKNPDNPPALLHWLQSSGDMGATHNYKVWQKDILEASFGKRKFVILDVKTQDIYGI